MGLNDSLRQTIIVQNAPNRFIQKIAFTATALRTTFNRVTDDDYAYPVRAGDMLAIWTDEDMWFEMRPLIEAPPITGVTTVLSGDRPGTFLFAQQFYFLTLGPRDVDIEIVRDSADGTAVLYLVKP